MGVKYGDFERARDVDIIDVLGMCGMYPDRYGRYTCIFHNDRSPSAYIRFNRLFCFACNEHWSTIDVVMQSRNVSKEDAVKMILELCEHNINFDKEELIHREKQRIKLKKEENPEYEEVRESFLKKARAIIDSEKDSFIDYIEKDRKINKRVLDVLDKNGIIYGMDDYNQPSFIFDYKHCVYRRLDLGENHSCVITEGASSYAKIQSNPMPVFYVTEGIFDALTLLDRDTPCNVICLNSINKLDNLIKDITSDWNYKKCIFILALDNDDKGRKSSKKLIEILKNNNIRYSYFRELIENPDCKDVNELRQKGII